MKEKDNDRMFTFTLPGEPAQGELIPSRDVKSEPQKCEEIIPKRPEADQSSGYSAAPTQRKSSYPPYFYYHQKQPSTRIENTILELNKSPVKRNFYALAQKYADITAEEEISEIPFMCYWPSYEMMSEGQLNWYFYIRTKIRKYEYPKTDLSYIFLYIYELINGVGIQNAEDGLYRMIRTWHGYKNLYNKLNEYLPDWIIDYMDVYKCRSDAVLQLLNDLDLSPYISENYIITGYLNTDKVLPIDVIAKLSDYAFYKSNFIIKKPTVEGETDDGEPDIEKMFLNGLPLLIRKVDIYMKSEGKGIFDLYQPEVIHVKGKIPFRSAVFEKNLRVDPITSDYMNFKPLRSFITLIIKHYENALRALCRYRGKLRADALQEEVIKVIKSCADEQYAQSRRKETIITVDKEKLIRLIRESEIIKKMLLEPANDESDARMPSVPDDETTADIPDDNDEEEFDEVEETIEETQNDDDDTGRFVRALSDDQRSILLFLIEGGRCGEKRLSGQFRNVFISTEADAVNEKFLEIFGDLLIACENGVWYVMEDYADEINKYLKQM